MNASCQCGAISFKTPLPKPLAIYICHCDECRLQSSSAFGCSAIFPRFELPSKDVLSCYTRPTASGHILNCYFCRTCGVRIIHSTPGKAVVSVKGGCIQGLDWGSARHIWCKRAMVPIPEGVERWDGEPSDDDVHGPRDDEGGVGGGGKGKRTRRMSGTTASGSRSVLGVEGTEGTGSKAVGAAAEKKREGFGLEVDTLAQSDVEREIVEMTRRFERKQLARRMEVEKEEEREGELSLH